jgi:uncharacterized membrane protein HdeD (DUF308 family)
MKREPSGARPYIHWPLDRLKLMALFGLFGLLLGWALLTTDISGALAPLWLWLARFLA